MSNDNHPISPVPQINIMKQIVMLKNIFKRVSIYKKIVKKIFISIILLFLVAAIIFFLKFYLTKKSPETIIKKAISSMSDRRYLKYHGVADITFSYSDRMEKVNINDFEVYSLIKRSSSDRHTVDFSGSYDHGTSSSGTFILEWKISDKKMFMLMGNHVGYNLAYKIVPFDEYTGLIDEKFVNEYSYLDLSLLFQNILSEKTLTDIKGVKLDDFEFIIREVLRDDVIEGENSYHYKVEVVFPGTLNLEQQIKQKNADLWIGRNSGEINRIKHDIEISNFGVEGNDIRIQLDIFLK